MFRTLKYTPAYPAKPFENVVQARAWVYQFVTWYNTQHRHSGIEFVTPEQRHQGQDGEILQKRKVVYAQAKECKPERWKNRNTRRWCKIKEVWLNPPREKHRHHLVNMLNCSRKLIVKNRYAAPLQNKRMYVDSNNSSPYPNHCADGAGMATLSFGRHR